MVLYRTNQNFNLARGSARMRRTCRSGLALLTCQPDGPGHEPQGSDFSVQTTRRPSGPSATVYGPCPDCSVCSSQCVNSEGPSRLDQLGGCAL